MIVTRTPLRVSLGGGGTDLPNYAAAHGGLVLSAAVDKYVYVAVRQGRVDGCSRYSYEDTQISSEIDALAQPIVREALRLLRVEDECEVVSMGEIPAGSGLGSSGAFCVGLLHALHALKGERLAVTELAEEAHDLERNRLQRPVGKHDHYMAGLGGIRCLRIGRDGSVAVEALDPPDGTIRELERRLALFFTGRTRDSEAILRGQDVVQGTSPRDATHYLHDVRRIGEEVTLALRRGDLAAVGALFHEHWLVKRRASGVTDSHFDGLYELARANGAVGGKLLGAGGGGFFLFYVEREARPLVVAALTGAGARHVSFSFEVSGTKLLLAEARAPHRGVTV